MSEETMKDFEAELEASYSMMGDGTHSTDQLYAWQKAEELLESKEPVTVTINGIVKGGVVADFDGLRAFIPASGLTLDRGADLNKFLLSEVTVQVIEVNIDEDKLILSGKELLKAAKENEKKLKISEISIGQVMTGTVESLKDYGAFINLGDGLTGLVHISQISKDRIKHPKVVLSEGQEVTVKVIDIKDGKLSLSIKALLEDNEAEEEVNDYELPETESVGTSLGSLFANLKLQ